MIKGITEGEIREYFDHNPQSEGLVFFAVDVRDCEVDGEDVEFNGYLYDPWLKVDNPEGSAE